MPLRRWKTLTRETRIGNPWWSYMHDTVLLPSGSRGEYHYVHTPGSVMVIPRRDDGRIVLVRQYRYLNDRESVEFPAGGIKDGAAAEDAARDELREETSLQAGRLTKLGSFNPFNGVTDELCALFLAERLATCEGTPDETEEFEILHRSPDEITAMIVAGEIWDGMTLAAWARFAAEGRDT